MERGSSATGEASVERKPDGDRVSGQPSRGQKVSFALGCLAVLCLGTAIRAWVAYTGHPPPRFVFSDMLEYVRFASILQWETPDPWLAFRPIGVPLIIRALDTRHGFVPMGFAWTQWATASLGVGLVPLLARRLGATRFWAVLAGLLAAVYPPNIVYVGWVLTEGISATLLVVMVLLAIETARCRSAWAYAFAACAGLVSGLAAGVRPNFVLAGLGLGVALWLIRGRRSAVPLMFVVSLGAGVLPFLLHGRFHTGSFGLATNGGVNFFLNFAQVQTITLTDQSRLVMTFTPVMNGVFQQGVFETEVSFLDQGAYYAMGLREIAENPGFALFRVGQNLFQQTGLGQVVPFPLWPEMYRPLQVGRVAHGVLVMTPLLVLGALGWLWRQSRQVLFSRERLVVWATFPGFIVAAAFFMGTVRTREPYDLLTFALAAAVLPALCSSLAKAISARRRIVSTQSSS